MNQKFVREEFDLYVWEGTSDIAARAERCLAGMDVTLVRADAGTAFPPPRDPGRPAVALVSVSVMGDNRFSGYDWLAVQALPIIWVASEARGAIRVTTRPNIPIPCRWPSPRPTCASCCSSCWACWARPGRPRPGASSR